MGSLNLSFGALSKPIAAQLDAQGLQLRTLDPDHYQKSADAITRLKIMGYLTESATRSAEQKLMKDIAKNVTYLQPK